MNLSKIFSCYNGNHGDFTIITNKDGEYTYNLCSIDDLYSNGQSIFIRVGGGSGGVLNFIYIPN